MLHVVDTIKTIDEPIGCAFGFYFILKRLK